MYDGGYILVSLLGVGDCVYYKYKVGYATKYEHYETHWWVDRIKTCEEHEDMIKIRLACAWTSITIVFKKTDKLVRFRKSLLKEEPT